MGAKKYLNSTQLICMSLNSSYFKFSIEFATYIYLAIYIYIYIIQFGEEKYIEEKYYYILFLANVNITALNR